MIRSKKIFDDKKSILLFSFAILLTGCFYGRVKINSQEKMLIPYSKINDLVFVSTKSDFDTIRLIRKHVKTTNLDFFIDKGLGSHDDNKKPYYESYSTDSKKELKRTINKHNSGGLKYDPFIFTFFKHQSDSSLGMYYFIDGRWRGQKTSMATFLDGILIVMALTTSFRSK